MMTGDAESRVEIPGAASDGSGRNPRDEEACASNITVARETFYTETDSMMEAVVGRENMWLALKRVERNKGSSGVDNMSVESLRTYLRDHWPRIREELLEGTPQGGPLSPLLSNILLDDLDKELERRGHAFCRYADDCNIYVRSLRAGERVLASITRFLEKRLRLKVNQDKSGVDRPWKRKFLGYSMTSNKEPRLKVAPESIRRFKSKIRGMCRRGRGRNLRKFIKELAPVLRGWMNYYRLAEVRGIFDELDGWIRRKLRCIIWRQWKRNYTRARNLMKLGLSEEKSWRSATNGRGPWWNAGASHMNLAMPKKVFDGYGLVSLQSHLQHLQCAT